jgi:hypothetical protein
MKTPQFLTTIAFIFTAAPLLAAEHPSLVSEVISTYKPKESDRSPAAIAGAGAAFLKGIPDERRAEAALPLDSRERVKWTNTPPRGPQGGVRLGDLDKATLPLACDFLNAVMSAQGYEKCVQIMLGDDKFLRNGEARAGFGAENFWLAVFGEPSADKPWAIQLDGHHIAVNITFVGDKMSFSPSFIGVQPHTFPINDKPVIPMEAEVGNAYAFVAMLDDDQKTKTVITDKRADVQTAAGKDGFIPELAGLKCDSLNDAQQQALLKLINLWVDDLPKTQAEARMKEITAELKDTHFAWNGPTTPGSDISYIIQGPSLIIEYACQDLGGKPLDHLHSMYRDPTNEYGERIINH